MIFIVVKFKPKPEYVESFPDKVAEFTAATRNEPGNMFFDWSRSVEGSVGIRSGGGISGRRRGQGARHGGTLQEVHR